MVEKALIWGLIALTLVIVLSTIGEHLVHQAERLQCAFEGAQVCVIDGDMNK
jgi:Flp pilus assembly pilin Flp